MPEENLYNEKELLFRISEGDEESFSAIFHKYRNRIFTVAFKLTSSAELAEEIVQDVFLKLWLKKSKIREITDFSSFLFIMARNEAYSYMRSLARRQLRGSKMESFIPIGIYTSDSDLLEKEFNSILQEAIDRLPDRQREVYLLGKEHGLKREEIANQLQLSPETVKAHMAQAMKFIRAYYFARFPWIAIFFMNFIS